MASTTSAAALRPVSITPLRKLGFLALVVYLFLLYSRVLDLKLYYLHIPILALYSCTAASFLAGGFLRAVTHRIGLALLLFALWMVMAFPFAVWKGGSAETLTEWWKTFLIYFCITGLILTYQQFRKAIYVFAFAVLVLSIMALLFGQLDRGRLVLGRGRFTNPNDLAQILLMALPFWWSIAKNPALSRRWRRLAYLAMVPIFITMARTGSRGALIGFAAVALVLFLRSPAAHKFQLIVGGALVLLLASVLLPDTLRSRYLTFFQPDEDAAADTDALRIQQGAVGSTEGRWQLLKDSVTLTALHPLFGVGPGNFPVAQDLYARETRGQKGHWQVTHNTYTEISSENGIPALLFYLAAAWFCFRATEISGWTRAIPPGRAGEAGSAALALRMALLAYLVSAMFSSFAYQGQFLTLAGLSVVFSRTVGQALARDDAEPEPAPPVRLRRQTRVIRPSPVWLTTRSRP